MKKIVIISSIVIFTIPTMLLSVWSLYDDDSDDYGWFHEYLYGIEEVNTFEVPDGYSTNIAAGEEYLYFTEGVYSSSMDIVETTLEGEVVNEFTVTAPEELNGMIAYDGEYLWLLNYDSEDILYCFTTDGDVGPFSPIEIDVSSIFAIDGWNERICIIVISYSDWEYREYSRTGELLFRFILPDPPSTEGYGTYNALAIEPDQDALIWTYCWDGVEGWGYKRKFTHDGYMVYEIFYLLIHDWAIGKSTIPENIEETSIGRIKSLFAE